MNNTLIIGNGIFYKYGYYDFQCDECIKKGETHRCEKCKKIELDEIFKKELKKIIDEYLLEVERAKNSNELDWTNSIFSWNKEISKNAYNFFSIFSETNNYKIPRLAEIFSSLTNNYKKFFFSYLVYLKILKWRDQIDNKNNYYENLIEETDVFNDIIFIKESLKNFNKTPFSHEIMKFNEIYKNYIFFTKELSYNDKENDVNILEKFYLDNNLEKEINKYSLFVYADFINLAILNIITKFQSKNDEKFLEIFLDLKIKNWYTFNYLFDQSMTKDLNIKWEYNKNGNDFTYIHGKIFNDNLGFFKNEYEKYTGKIIGDNINKNYEKLRNDFIKGNDIFLFGVSPNGEERLIYCINTLENKKNIFISYKYEKDINEWKKLTKNSKKKHNFIFWQIDEWKNKSKEYFDEFRIKKLEEEKSKI